jgi:phosphatidylserine/phosphatidylglycerophosphate/cardiolipin synthase-like enzyme
MRLVSGAGHVESVLAAVAAARRSVWIATANLKGLMVEGPARPGRRRGGRGKGAYVSILSVLDDLAARGVELRLLHAGAPSRAFREEFDARPRLVAGGLELRRCPRVHLKAVIVDAELLYLGSANFTGAGLGAKHADRRNFELGIVTSDEAMLDDVQELYDRIWRGAECRACKLRDACEAPLDAA